jgi:DNA-binding LacI/PurR family transcriptional regulator
MWQMLVPMIVTNAPGSVAVTAGAETCASTFAIATGVPTRSIRGIHLPSPHTPHEAFDVASELLARVPECTAAITTGWQFTGFLSALRARDLHVPDDFSIVSVIASQYAEMFAPALTNIEWPAFEAGRRAGEILIERLASNDASRPQSLIGGQIVVRETTGPARRS